MEDLFKKIGLPGLYFETFVKDYERYLTGAPQKPYTLPYTDFDIRVLS